MVNLLSRFQQVRHQMLYLSLLFSVSIILFTVISCSADSSSNLLGKWEMFAYDGIFEGKMDGKIIKAPPGTVIEFFSDRTLDYERQNCNWTILEDGRIKITSPFGGVFYGLLQGDILKIGLKHFRKNK